jgi:hypothetical protein
MGPAYGGQAETHTLHLAMLLDVDGFYEGFGRHAASPAEKPETAIFPHPAARSLPLLVVRGKLTSHANAVYPAPAFSYAVGILNPPIFI